jgi:methyl-accepting chemotaxis protein
MENLAAGVEAGKGTVGKLITDTALADEAEQFLARANETMGELQGLVTNLNVAAARLPEITDAVADEAKDLPGLVRQTQTSMRELERVVEALQRHWLLRRQTRRHRARCPKPLCRKRNRGKCGSGTF